MTAVPTTHSRTDAAPVLARHHIAALIVVVPLLAALAVDWLVTGVTGERTFITDDEVPAPFWVGVLTTAGLCLACAALFWVLLAERPLFEGAQRFGRTLRISRVVLMIGLVAMIVGNGIIYPLIKAFDITGTLLSISDVIAMLGVAAMFLPALVIGLTQIRHNELGLGGRLLSLAVPAILLTALTAAVAEDWASPVLFTMTVLGGVSVLGVGARATRD